MMGTHTTFPELSSMELFRKALPVVGPQSAIADRLCAIGRFRCLARGEELVTQENDDFLVFVASGSAKLIARSKECEAGDASKEAHQILSFHFPGDIVSVVRHPSGLVCLGALDRLELVIFDTDQFLDTAHNEPLVLRTILTKSLQALQRSRTKVIQMGHKSARQRVAGFLVSIAARVCGGTEGKCQFSLPMCRSDIADSLGLTIETVSRQFSELKREGLLSTEGRAGIALPDIEALRREAGP